MSEGSANYHEPLDLLSEETKNMHRALVSVMEELEAIDWYQQRAEACSDPDLKKILLHNKNEEMEHALMGIEWIRRNSPAFDEQARKYLFSTGDLTRLEESSHAPSSNSTSAKNGGQGGGSLDIGSLRPRAL